MFGKNALVVDDSLTARTVLKHQLKQFDVVVESAHDGNHALKMLRSHTPDVIFLDHVMPGLDGFQVLERLKADRATRRIPVVMYTSQAAPHYIREAKVLGAVAVIPKDVTDEQLVDALNKAEVYQLNAANDERHVKPQGRESSGAAKARAANLRPVHPEARYVPTARSTERSKTAGKTTRSAAGNVTKSAAGARSRKSAATSGSSSWWLPLLLTALVLSQIHMVWRVEEQQRLIGDLHR
ncbi:MAG: response regulator, partial [Halioglobus sp.]|nr:response regulator [Halioglobus sp.]